MMTDPKAGIANIKKKKPVPNYKLYHDTNWRDWYPPFQRRQTVKILVKKEVSDYNSKAGKLPL